MSTSDVWIGQVCYSLNHLKSIKQSIILTMSQFNNLSTTFRNSCNYTTGSSETIRKTTFNFLKYKEKLVSHKKRGKIDVSFLQWFVGFSEGNGSFIVSKDRLFFIINQKEEKILHNIRTKLGFGKVSTYKAYSRFIVADKDNIERLIHLFNGNLVVDKTNSQFVSWVNNWNSSCKEDQRVEVLDPSNPLTFQHNSWLSGLIDAEGSFNAVQTKDFRYSLGWRLCLRFLVDQKQEKWLLEELRSFLGSGVVTRRKEVDNVWRFVSTSITSHEVIINYLNKHPLRTRKKVSFLRFASLLRYIKTKPELPWEGKVLTRVENLIKNISNS